MIDGIIKADGTSRLMRAELPATYEEFRAQCRDGTQPLDILFNALGWSRLPTFLNKENLLKDPTASLFSLGADAVPDDVFSFLGKYNLHWWKLTGAVTKYRLTETKADNYVAFVKNASKTIYYSSEIRLDENTGSLVLVNPTATNGSVTPTAGYYYQSKNGGIRLGIGTTNETDAIIKFTQVVLWGSDDNGNVVYQKDYAYIYTSEAYTASGETTFATSLNRNAYPDSGETDGVLYQYLGVPFQNAVTAPKIATGSYTGTGTYGSSNPNSLTFDFAPKSVYMLGFVFENKNNGSVTCEPQFGDADGLFAMHSALLTTTYRQKGGFCANSNSTSSAYGKKSDDGKTFYWYDTGSASNQCNRHNGDGTVTTYYWIAIG